MQERFKIVQKLTKGSFGQVYAGIDVTNPSVHIVCKINDEVQMNDLETQILKDLNEKQYRDFPQFFGAGHLKGKSYHIIERLGQTLEFYQMMNKTQFSYKTVHQVGIQLVSLLEKFHSIGYVYNDLKPDNICVGKYKVPQSLN